MNNMLNTSGSSPSPCMPSLNVSMWAEEEICPEGDQHMTQQLQLCSSYYSNCSPNSSSFNCPQNQQYFDLSYPQGTSSTNQLPQPLNNYASQYQVQMPLAPDTEYSNQLGLELGYRPFPPSTESSWALAQFFKSRERYYAFGNQPPRCQAEDCNADLTSAKRYHKRHKVCEFHSKAAIVHLGGGIMQRFCQQCSRFHMLDEFDDSKKSCRRRLADHNLRRRKPKPHFPVPSNSDTPINSTETVNLEQINALNAKNAATSTAGGLHASISSSLSANHEIVISGPSSGAQLQFN